MLPDRRHKTPLNLTQFSTLFHPEDWDMLIASSEQIHLKRGEKLYTEGEKSQRIYFVQTGLMKIYRKGNCVRPHILRFVSANNFLGYRSSFAKDYYLATAKAFTPVEVLGFSAELMQQIMQRSPRVSLYFLEKMAHELGVSDRRIVSLTQKQIPARLAETLLLLRDNFGVCPETNKICIEITREDLAGLSNMVTANVVRTLSKFAKEGLIELNRRCICMVDEQRLIAIANNQEKFV